MNSLIFWRCAVGFVNVSNGGRAFVGIPLAFAGTLDIVPSILKNVNDLHFSSRSIAPCKEGMVTQTSSQ